MSARFFTMIGGYRIQTDTVQVTLTEAEAKELVRSVVQFMSDPEGEFGVIPQESLEWLDETESWGVRSIPGPELAAKGYEGGWVFDNLTRDVARDLAEKLNHAADALPGVTYRYLRKEGEGSWNY